MKDCYRRLMKGMRLGLHGPPTDLMAAVRGLPVDDMPSPQVTWTLIAMARYRERQHWAKELMMTHLMRGTIPDRDASGIVPGMPEWAFAVEDRFCQPTNRVTREAIGVMLALPLEPGFAGCDFQVYMESWRVPARANRDFFSSPPPGSRAEERGDQREAITGATACAP